MKPETGCPRVSYSVKTAVIPTSTLYPYRIRVIRGKIKKAGPVRPDLTTEFTDLQIGGSAPFHTQPYIRTGSV